MKIFGYEIRKSDNKNNNVNDNCYYHTSANFSLFNQNQGLDPYILKSIDLISNLVASTEIEVTDVYTKEKQPKFFLSDRIDSNIGEYHFLKYIVKNTLLRGNTFCIIERNTKGYIENIKLVNNQDIKYNIKDFDISYQYKNSPIENINVLNFRFYPSNDNIFIGKSLISYLSNYNSLSSTLNNLTSSMLESGGISGLLSVSNTSTYQQREDILKNFTNTFNSSNSGSGKVFILPNSVSYNHLQKSLNELQVSELSNKNKQDILNVIGVPMQMLDFQNLNEDILNHFITFTLQPIFEMIESELEKAFLNDYTFEFKPQKLSRINKSTLSTFIQTMVNNGVINRNEARNLIDFEEVADNNNMNDFIIPFSVIEQNTINSDTPKDDELK